MLPNNQTEKQISSRKSFPFVLTKNLKLLEIWAEI